MAKAETTRVDNFIAVELCRDLNCSCRKNLASEPDEIRIGKPVIKEPAINTAVIEETITPLEFFGRSGEQSSIEVPGFHLPKKIIEAFNNCAGPVNDGEIVCGAIYALAKKRPNVR